MKVKVDVGWKMWILGLPLYEAVDADGTTKLSPIRTYKLLKGDMLPKNIRGKFWLKYQPIFQLMVQAPEFQFRDCLEDIDANFINS